MPAPDGGDDFVWIGAPDEGSGFLIVLFNEAVDGGLEVDNRMEDAVLQAPPGQCGEEAFDGVEPRT